MPGLPTPLGTAITVALLAFAVAIVVGMTVRGVRAPRGQRLRAAFGPLAGAGETYQELHTGQRGLQDSIVASVQEQEQGGGAERDATGPLPGAPHTTTTHRPTGDPRS